MPAVLECAGTAAALRDCCLAAAKGGVVSVIGIPHEEPQLPMKRIVLDEIEIVGDRANPNTAEAALALLVNGRVDLTPLMTHRFPLASFPARARDLRAPRGRRGEGGDQAVAQKRRAAGRGGAAGAAGAEAHDRRSAEEDQRTLARPPRRATAMAPVRLAPLHRTRAPVHPCGNRARRAPSI